MKQQDLNKHHHMTIPELKLAVTQLEKKLIEARMQIKLGQEKNLHLGKNIRQDIARIKTIIRHKELTGDTQEKPTETKKPSKKPTKKTTKKSTSTKKDQ